MLVYVLYCDYSARRRRYFYYSINEYDSTSGRPRITHPKRICVPHRTTHCDKIRFKKKKLCSYKSEWIKNATIVSVHTLFSTPLKTVA